MFEDMMDWRGRLEGGRCWVCNGGRETRQQTWTDIYNDGQRRAGYESESKIYWLDDEQSSNETITSLWARQNATFPKG